MSGGSPPSRSPENLEDYSPTATLILFNCPLPLLRGPIKAGPSDDPSSGLYLLAFKSPRAWAAAYKACEAQIISQCESGARIGCSISASSKCKRPWWETILGISSKQDLSERAKCEEREMEAYFAAAKEKCGDFAKQKCGPAFEDARIVVSGADLKATVDREDAFKLISGVCFSHERKYGVVSGGVDKSWEEFRRRFEVTCVRGNDLLSSDGVKIEDYLRRSS